LIHGEIAMSDAPQGPGWWKASDGRFYPPTAQPGPVPSPPQPGAAPSTLPPGAFIRSLYNFRFTEFITPQMIRFFYGFSVVVLTIIAVIYLIAAFASGDETAIILGLIGIPIIYFIYVIFTRIAFELIAIVFRMADDLRAIRRRGEGL
jgi:hypothetical protein